MAEKSSPSLATVSICRTCLAHRPRPNTDGACQTCGDTRYLHHDELESLSIAHVDCDAFYATVEKRDNPALMSKPVIVGGGQRGVVATCCYLARIRGVRSAMPMFKAKKLCPEAVIVKPRMSVYRTVSGEIRALFDGLTPLVEPLSLDEAFLDLTGTEALTGLSPAEQLIKLARTIEDRIGVTVSVGLSHNKFLAKLASDLDKPRGFSVIGRLETKAILARLPLSKLPGFGKKTVAALARDGLTQISQLQALPEETLIQRYGDRGLALARLAHGVDHRPVKSERAAKSVSAETTLSRDVTQQADVETILLAQCEHVAADLKRKSRLGATITLKLKTNRHRIITRSVTLEDPTQMAHQLFEHSKRLLTPLIDGTLYRLVGVGVSNLHPADQPPDQLLFSDAEEKQDKNERAMDALRAKFGPEAVIKGRLLKTPKNRTMT